MQRPRRRLRFIRLQSPPLFGFVGLCALSICAANGAAVGMVDLVQGVDYYLIWFCIVAWACGRRRLRNCLILGAGMVLIAGAGSAVLQIMAGESSFLVRSLFRDHPTYVTAFVMLTPLVWARVVSSRPKIFAGLGHVVIGAGCALLASLAGTALVLLELWFASRILGENWLRRGLATTSVTLIVFFCLPESYRDGLVEAERNRVSVPLSQRRKEVLLAMQSIAPPKPAAHLGVGPWHFFLASNIGYKPHLDLPTTTTAPNDEKRGIAETFSECWSALELVATGPMLGAGLGHWQERIGAHFGILERTGTLFPNSSNGYLMLAVTTGLPGLTAWLLTLMGSHRRAIRRLRRCRAPDERASLSGSLAGLIGATVCMFVCPFTFQPVAVYWALLAAIVHSEPALEGSERPI